jgi:hypothetical protein
MAITDQGLCDRLRSGDGIRHVPVGDAGFCVSLLAGHGAPELPMDGQRSWRL